MGALPPFLAGGIGTNDERKFGIRDVHDRNLLAQRDRD